VAQHAEQNPEHLLAYYPECLPTPEAGPWGYLLVASDPDPRIIGVGRKLCVRL